MSELICTNCRNEDICKWCSDMKFKQEQVDNIPVTKELTPVTINIDCKSFQRKALKQDGCFIDPNNIFRK